MGSKINFYYETGFHLAVIELPICIGDAGVAWNLVKEILT
jgi:hypothetical protein